MVDKASANGQGKPRTDHRPCETSLRRRSGSEIRKGRRVRRDRRAVSGNLRLESAADKASDEAGKREELLNAIEKAGDVEVGTGGDVKVAKDFPTMIAEYRAQYGCSYQDALLAVRKAHPKAHEDWIKSVN